MPASEVVPRRSAENARRWEARFEKPMFAAALLVLPAMALDTPGVDAPWRTVGVALNVLTWSAFAIEFAVMMSVVPSRTRYLRDNPIDVVIVFLTIPVVLSALSGLRTLRLLRVLRLLRLEPVVRWLFSTGGVRYAAMFSLLVVTSAGLAFSEIERDTSRWDGMYWAITTMTTVGYGDPAPDTAEGKALAVIVMLVGIGFVAVLTGSLAERFVEARDDHPPPQLPQDPVDDDELLKTVDRLSAQLEELRATLTRR